MPLCNISLNHRKTASTVSNGFSLGCLSYFNLRSQSFYSRSLFIFLIVYRPQKDLDLVNYTSYDPSLQTDSVKLHNFNYEKTWKRVSITCCKWNKHQNKHQIPTCATLARHSLRSGTFEQICWMKRRTRSRSPSTVMFFRSQLQAETKQMNISGIECRLQGPWDQTNQH